MSEDDLGPVDTHIEVDEVSSSSDDTMLTSSDEDETKDQLLAWGTRKSNYYGGIEDVGLVVESERIGH